MSQLNDLIDRYFAMWNETDPERRRAIIASVWTDDARYCDPMQQGDGPDGINAMVQGLQGQLPGYQVRRTSEIDTHHDQVRFSWELAPEDGPAIADGIDIGVVAGGRLRSITGFFDRAPDVSAAEPAQVAAA